MSTEKKETQDKKPSESQSFGGLILFIILAIGFTVIPMTLALKPEWILDLFRK